MLHQKVRDKHSKLRRHEASSLTPYVVTFGQRLDRRRVCGRAADTQFFQRFHQGSIRESGRRFRKMLLVLQVQKRQHFSGLEIRQRIVLLLFPALNDQAAGKLQPAAAGAEKIFTGRDVRRILRDDRGRHLAGNRLAPDNRVKLKLVRRQVLLDVLRMPEHGRRADRLMRGLGVFSGLVNVRLLRQVTFTVFLQDKPACFFDGHSRQADRGGPHVGDEAYTPLAAHFPALVQRLGGPHRLRGRKLKKIVGGLLELAGRKRRIRVPPFLLFLDLADNKRKLFYVFDSGRRRLSVLHLNLLIVYLFQ